MLKAGVSPPSSVANLEPEDQVKLNKLWDVWSIKLTSNQQKETYYNLKNRIKNMGISIPRHLEQFGTVIGWPTKAVDILANRSIFEGFGFKSGRNSDLDEILRQNNFDLLYQQSVESELISCAFMTVSKGEDGEPEVVTTAYSAQFAAAKWNKRKKRIDYGMAIVKSDKDGEPTEVNLYTDECTIVIWRGTIGWEAEYYPHIHGRPLIEPLMYRPSLDKPLGRSRINQAVMDITNAAMRTTLRTEVAAEFFTSPLKYLLGVDDDFWTGEIKQNDKGEDIIPDTTQKKTDATLGGIFTVGYNDNGDIPHFGQLTQMSMQPHTDHLRSLAAQFSGETSVPVSSLGIVQDNPSSAEAIYAAKEDLVIEANNLNKTNGVSLKNIGLLALAVLQDKAVNDLTDEEKSIGVNWMNPATPSIVSQADAMVKTASINETVATALIKSGVLFEELGFSDEQRRRLENSLRAASALDTLNNIATGGTEKKREATMYKITSVLRQLRAGQITKETALKLLAMEGVSDEDAAGCLSSNEMT